MWNFVHEASNYSITAPKYRHIKEKDMKSKATRKTERLPVDYLVSQPVSPASVSQFCS